MHMYFLVSKIVNTLEEKVFFSFKIWIQLATYIVKNIHKIFKNINKTRQINFRSNQIYPSLSFQVGDTLASDRFSWQR